MTNAEYMICTSSLAANCLMMVAQFFLIRKLWKRHTKTSLVGMALHVAWMVPTGLNAISALTVLANINGGLGIPTVTDVFQNFAAATIPCWMLYKIRWFEGELHAQKDDTSGHYRMLVRVFPDHGLLLVDRKTREIIECNTAFAKAVGYTLAGEVVGRCADEFTRYPTEHAAKVNATTQNIEERPVEIRCKGGQAKPGLLTIILLNGVAMARVRFTSE